MRAMKFTKEAYVARQSLKTKKSEDHQKLVARSWRHQRVWRSLEAEVHQSVKTASIS